MCSHMYIYHIFFVKWSLGHIFTFQIVSLLHVGISSAWEPWLRHRALEPKNQPHRQDMLHLLARYDGANWLVFCSSLQSNSSSSSSLYIYSKPASHWDWRTSDLPGKRDLGGGASQIWEEEDLAVSWGGHHHHHHHHPHWNHHILHHYHQG